MSNNDSAADGADATGAQKFDEGDQQVDGEDEEFAHGTNRTKTASARKTAPHRRVPSYYEFATDTMAKTLAKIKPWQKATPLADERT